MVPKKKQAHSDNSVQDFKSRSENFQKFIQITPADQDPDKVLEAALALVALRYEKANSAPYVIELLRRNEVELALKCIEYFEGDFRWQQPSYRYWRKITLYILCLAELTLVNKLESAQNREAIQKILKHWKDHIPKDPSLVLWEDSCSSFLVFLVAVEIHKAGEDFSVLYPNGTEWDYDWILFQGPYSDPQVEVLLRGIAAISYEDHRKRALNLLVNVLTGQGNELLAEKIRETYQWADEQLDKNLKSKPNYGLPAYLGTRLKDFSGGQDSKDFGKAIFVLLRRAIELQGLGEAEKVYEKMGKAFELSREITEEKVRCEIQKILSGHIASFGSFNQAFQVYNAITDKAERDEACLGNAHILALNGRIKEAVSFTQAILDVPVGSMSQNEKERELRHQAFELGKLGKFEDCFFLLGILSDETEKSQLIIELVKHLHSNGKIEAALAFAKEIPEAYFKVEAFLELCNVLTMQGEKGVALNLLQEAKGIAERMAEDFQKFSLFGKIALNFIKIKEKESAIDLIKKLLKIKKVSQKAITGRHFLVDLYEMLIQEADLEQANYIISTIEDQKIKNRVWLALAVKFAKAGKTAEALSIWGKVVVKELGFFPVDFIYELTYQGNLKDAIFLVEDYGSKKDKDSAWGRVAEALAGRGELDKALEMAEKIKHHFNKETALKAIAREYVKEGLIADALGLQKLLPKQIRENFLASLVKILAEAIQPETKKSYTKEILGITSRMTRGQVFDQVLNEISRILAEKKLYQVAEKVGSNISSGGIRAQLWHLMGLLAAESHGGESAFSIAKKFEFEETAPSFRKGIVLFYEMSKSLKEVLNILVELKDDLPALESLLRSVSLNELFQGEPSQDVIRRFNTSLNIQWAIDITNEMRDYKKRLPKTVDVEDDDYLRFIHT